MTGLTIFKYLCDRRINQAKLLFQFQPEITVTEASRLSGFKRLRILAGSSNKVWDVRLIYTVPNCIASHRSLRGADQLVWLVFLFFFVKLIDITVFRRCAEQVKKG